MKASLTVRIKAAEAELAQLRTYVPNPVIEWGLQRQAERLEQLQRRRAELEAAGVSPDEHFLL